MAATHIDTMVTKYETLLEKAAGLKNVNIDGVVVSYDDLEKKYFFWVRKQKYQNFGRVRSFSFTNL